jgi:hypothetical protein
LYNKKQPLTAKSFWKTGVLLAIASAAVVFFFVYFSQVIGPVYSPGLRLSAACFLILSYPDVLSLQKSTDPAQSIK